MFVGLNNIWTNLKHFILENHKPAYIVQENLVGKPNASLTLDAQGSKVPTQDSNSITNDLNNIFTLNADNTKKNAHDVNCKTSRSNMITTDPKDYDEDKNVISGDNKFTASNILPRSRVHIKESHYNLNMTEVVSQYVPVRTVKAQDDNIKDSSSWKSLIMDGPCSYSEMGKPFDKVLFKYAINTQQVIKKIKHENWELKLVHIGTIGVDQCCVRNNIIGKTNFYENYISYFKVGEENDFGVRSVINENFSNDSRLSLNLKPGNKAINSLYTAFKFKQQTVVLDANLKFTQNYQPKKMGFNTELSGVFGHSFENFGLLAGFSLAKNFVDDSEWIEICQSVSLGIVFPSIVLRVTVQPIQKLCTPCLYYKINDKTEIACCSQGNWSTQEISKENLKVGFIHKYTDSLTFGLKSNLNGNITTGVWYKTDEFNVGICTYFHYKNQFEEVGRNIGISVEF